MESCDVEGLSSLSYSRLYSLLIYDFTITRINHTFFTKNNRTYTYLPTEGTSDL